MDTGSIIKQLSRDWSDAGICPADTVLVHSSASRTVRRKGLPANETGLTAIVLSLMEAVGKEGTVLFPTFNFGFCSGRDFDINLTPSEMGLLSEVARKMEGAVRTGHAIYSFCAIGRRARDLLTLENVSGYGRDSPFALLPDWDGKIAALDVPDSKCMTFYHHVEEMRNVGYRYHKFFSGNYTDRTRQTTRREFSIFVRKIEEGVVTKVDGMEERLWASGAYSGQRPGIEHGMRVIPAKSMFDRVSEVIEAGEAKGNLFEVE